MNDNLQKAIELIKSGQKKEGGHLLIEFVKRYPENESAWLWLAFCVSTNKDKIYCLEKALGINPQNIAARKELQKLMLMEQFSPVLVSKSVKSQTNTLAIISLITTFLGWAFAILFIIVFIFSESADSFSLLPAVLAGATWILSIIMGYIGLRQIKTQESQTGDGFAKSGIIISGIGCGILLCLFSISLLALVRVLEMLG